MNYAPVQDHMRKQGIDAWLVYDFRGSNPVLAQLLGGKRWTTRRAAMLIPSNGEPVLLAHGIDGPSFAGVTVRQESYLSWRDLHDWLGKKLRGVHRLAMEYSPRAELPAASFVDGGTIELVRSTGVEVVSSADLIQVCVARWSPEAQEGHAVASRKVGAIKDEAFQMIRDRLARGQAVTEFDVQQHILARFKAEGLETPDSPIVAANANGGDPHHETSEATAVPIKRDDWILIDLWARLPGDQNVFSDITWVGYAGREVPPKHREVFEVVRRARDSSLKLAVDSWKARKTIQGWELDDAARNVIIDAGYQRGVRHRTGHSLSPGPLVHGMGMNLDNLETHDTREMLPGIGFTIEPGIYLPEFGVRLEINVWVDPQQGPVVTSVFQENVVLVA